jgi:hypothetical protein
MPRAPNAPSLLAPSLAPSLVAASLLALAACGAPQGSPFTDGEVPFTPERPPLASPGPGAPRYAGSDPLVLQAQATYGTGYDLHSKFVMRTCGPTNGVCHNQKEYPDLHTAGTFLAALNAPCNVQPGSWQAVFDRCERLGDRLRAPDEPRDVELGWVDLVAGPYVDYRPDGQRPTLTSPGLHVRLRAPLATKRQEFWGAVQLVRRLKLQDGTVGDVVFAHLNTHWWVLGDGTQLFAEVRDDQLSNVEALLRGGVVQGDHNRNGVFGAETGLSVSLLEPGHPERSYLLARMRGHMRTPDGVAQAVPGTRMPLANIPPSVPDMLALFCWLEGLPRTQGAGGAYTLASGIDYAGCSYTANPGALDVLGTGARFRTGIFPMLQARCGGCHGGASPQASLDLMNDDPATPDKDAVADVHARLVRASRQRPEMVLVAPGDLTRSYLWLKVDGQGGITGSRMPVDAAGQGTALPEDALQQLSEWVRAGALLD